MRTMLISVLFLVFLCACSARTLAPTADSVAVSDSLAVETSTMTPLHTASNTPELKRSAETPQPPGGKCSLPPFIAPTIPATIPAYTQLDETTGLHMTGKVQVIDLATYRLAVTGKVDHPLNLSIDDLRCMPKITATSDLICYGVFSDSGTWSGVPIKYVLEQAGIEADAKNVVLKSADDFQFSLPIQDVLNEKNFLAYEMEGKPLPILHGFPLRAVFPTEPGGRWVKWLVALIVE